MMATLYCGDALAVLRTLPDGAARCCVTSPPYWRQRDYGVPGQIGLELAPETYIHRLVEVFREVRRVLTDDGTLWLNLGDKWASGGNGGGGSFMEERGEAWAHAKHSKGWRSPPKGYKDKDLLLLPAMTAIALRDDGWYLRQCNIWAKPNGMPDSVSDRSTVSHEYVFQLTKRADYYYDAEAARTPAAPSTETRLAQDVERQAGSVRANGGLKTNGTMKGGAPLRQAARPRAQARAGGANLRSVWWISTAQCREAHFAVMPDALARICILSSSQPGDMVLDPFGGAGTTAAVAVGNGRSAIYVDLNPKYLDLAEQRIGPMLCERAP